MGRHVDGSEVGQYGGDGHPQGQEYMAQFRGLPTLLIVSNLEILYIKFK